MSVLVLSERHRDLGGWCNACNRSVGRRRFVAALQITVNSVVHVFKLCRPCLRAAARIAGDVK